MRHQGSPSWPAQAVTQGLGTQRTGSFSAAGSASILSSARIASIEPAGAAYVGPRQVDLGGHAPGTVGGPPDVRALSPAAVQAGECDHGPGRPPVEEVVAVRQAHPRPFEHRAWHRPPPGSSMAWGCCPVPPEAPSMNRRPSRSRPTRRTSSPPAWPSSPARSRRRPRRPPGTGCPPAGPGRRTGAARPGPPAAAQPNGTARPPAAASRSTRPRRPSGPAGPRCPGSRLGAAPAHRPRTRPGRRPRSCARPPMAPAAARSSPPGPRRCSSAARHCSRQHYRRHRITYRQEQRIRINNEASGRNDLDGPLRDIRCLYPTIEALVSTVQSAMIIPGNAF